MTDTKQLIARLLMMDKKTANDAADELERLQRCRDALKELLALKVFDPNGKRPGIAQRKWFTVNVRAELWNAACAALAAADPLSHAKDAHD